MFKRSAVTSFILFAFFILPVVSADELVHLVKQGETIFSLARQYKVDQNELMRFNGMSDPSKLQSGQRLRIPGKSADVRQAADKVQSGSEVSWNGTHKVAPGETIYGLSRKFSVTQEDLLSANGFSAGHVLKEGSVLKVPGVAIADIGTGGVQAPVPPEKAPVTGGKNTVVSGTQSAGNQAGTRTETGSAAAPSNAEKLMWPVNVKEINNMAGRPGVAITGERDEVVKSLTRGLVISAGPFRDYGRVVIIQVDGGYYYVYGGCQALLVKEGDRVLPGTELGRLGIDKVSGKPLLLFLVYRSDTPIDPAKAPRA